MTTRKQKPPKYPPEKRSEQIKWTPASEKPGAMHRESWGRTILLEARIGYPGSRVSDLRIGANIHKILNEDIRVAVVDEKRDFDTRTRINPKGHTGDNPLMYMTRAKGYVMVKHPGFAPFAMKESEWLALPLRRRSRSKF